MAKQDNKEEQTSPLNENTELKAPQESTELQDKDSKTDQEIDLSDKAKDTELKTPLDKDSKATQEAETLTTAPQEMELSDKAKEREKIAGEVFHKNEGVTVLYFTSDCIPFFQETDAVAHSNALDDKLVVTVNKQ